MGTRHHDTTKRLRASMLAAGLALSAAAFAAACGNGDNGTGGAPTPPGGGGGGGGGTPATTITITASGASPRDVTVPVGSTVMFVNNDNAGHDMASDPHPVHTDCPALNLVGFLSTGQSRATGALTTARTCGFHDHINPDNTSLQGTIRVQ